MLKYYLSRISSLFNPYSGTYAKSIDIIAKETGRSISEVVNYDKNGGSPYKSDYHPYNWSSLTVAIFLFISTLIFIYGFKRR